MKKIVYIIPGFEDSGKKKIYQKIAKIFSFNEIEPVIVNIKWNSKAEYKAMSSYVNQFLKKYKRKKNYEIYLFGFSFGAMIAFISSARIKAKTTVLCSLSPFFKEDIEKFKRIYLKRIEKLTLKKNKDFSFNKISKSYRCKTFILVGSKEHKEVISRAKEAHKKIKNSKLIIIKGAKHSLSKKEYFKGIKKLINQI